MSYHIDIKSVFHDDNDNNVIWCRYLRGSAFFPYPLGKNSAVFFLSMLITLICSHKKYDLQLTKAHLLLVWRQGQSGSEANFEVWEMLHLFSG